MGIGQAFYNQVINESMDYQDNETGMFSAIRHYCELNGIDEQVAEEIIDRYELQLALDVGVPLSVATGKKKLSECFSREYINHMCNRSDEQ
jgi:hypothetical protein